MSNEPFSNPNAPYASPGIPVQQPSTPFSAGGSGGERKKGLLVAGIVVAVAGIGGGVAAFLASGSAADEAVKNLARAPVGCTTRLEFEDTGTFTIFVETTGTTEDVEGDCPSIGDYERDADDIPDVDVTLTDDDGTPLDRDSDDSKSYDAGGFVGQSILTVEIEDPGRFDLTVTSDDDDFAIAVGKDPGGAGDTLKMLSYLLIGLGLVVGALLIVLGLRKRPAAAGGSGGGGGGAGTPVTYYPEQQPPAGYTPTGTHAPASPPSWGGGFAPPSSPQPPEPTQQFPSPQWPSPPNQ